MLGIDHGFSSNSIEQAALEEGEDDDDFSLHFGFRDCIGMVGSVKDDAGIAALVVDTR